MINLMKIALVTLVVSFVDSAVLDRSGKDVQGIQGFKAVENPTYSTDISNPKIFNQSENLRSKPSYGGVITEDDLECDEEEVVPTDPLSSQTSIEKGKTQIIPFASPQVFNNSGTFTNEEDGDENATQNAHNLASIIISEILEGISKSTENITQEITADSDEDEISNLEGNEEEIQIFQEDLNDNKDGEEIGGEDATDEEVTISGKDIENEEDDNEEEEQESTEDPQNLTSLLISQFMDDFFKSDRSQNTSIDDGNEEEVETVDEAASEKDEKMTDGSAAFTSSDNLTKREIGFIDTEDEEIEDSDRNTEDDFDNDSEEVTEEEEEVKETLLISNDEEEIPGADEDDELTTFTGVINDRLPTV